MARIETSLRKRDAALAALQTLQRQAPHCGMTHVECCEAFGKILRDLGKVPQWVKSYLHGYYDKISNDWYQHDLVWCHKSPDGKFYINCRVRDCPAWALPVDPLYMAGRGAEIATW